MSEFRSGKGNIERNQRKGIIHRGQRWINERTRQPYSGPVHYHNGRAMVGARHTSEPHDYLIPAKSVNSHPGQSMAGQGNCGEGFKVGWDGMCHPIMGEGPWVY